jgi:hypothetical protein
MTLEEARKVAKVCETCDEGSWSCAQDLAAELQKAFPEFTWTYSFSPHEIQVEEDAT